MDNFTHFITETRKNYDSGSLLSSEINQYLNKVNKVIPQNVQLAINLSKKYNLLDPKDLDMIRNSSKSALKKLADKFNINIDKLVDFWQLLKDIKSKIRLMPQYQSQQEREAMMLGKLSMDDLTINLSTQQGRNAAAKVYMPMIYKIVNQYIGKSNLTRQELISAALVGFTGAMNDWKKEGDDDKKVTFKTYAGYRAKQQILNDINQLSHSLSGTSWYSAKQGVIVDAASLDSIIGVDDNDFKQDHLVALGASDADWNLSRNEEKQWKELYDLLNRTFKQRELDVFYRYFGLNGYKREKSKDIAKSLGMSEGNIRNSIINKMINFLKSNNKAADILSGIQDIYNESLMVELMGMDKEFIMDALLNDDTFILLEELNKWRNKSVFSNSIYSALDSLNIEDSRRLTEILNGDFEILDKNYKKNKNAIIFFLSKLYPTENINKKTDVSILDYMSELQELYQKYDLD